MSKRVLISTIAPIDGGVPTMAAYIASLVRQHGYEPYFAYYQPYSLSPELSVPSYRLLQREVAARSERVLGGAEGHALGAWLPELEFTHYLPTRLWRDLMRDADALLAVSGNCLAAAPFALRKQAFWAWVATPWSDDRDARVAAFPWARRYLDRLLAAPLTRRLERMVLRCGGTVGLSRYTRERLNRISGGDHCQDVLPMGIDTDVFQPHGSGSDLFTVGFTGRLNDARKNLDLLLQALALCRQAGQPIQGLLVGGDFTRPLENRLRELNLLSAVRVVPVMDREKLPGLLQQMDLFAVPSHQEGLCIAALEAMSCGIPVVATRCGGPEEFVRDRETGLLVDFEAPEFARAIGLFYEDDLLRERCARGARKLVKQQYSTVEVAGRFWRSLTRVFPQLE